MSRTGALSRLDRFQGCLVGLAAGDAVGTTLEFRPRGTFPPISDMVGGGPFCLRPGQWTDDTSMALCLASSLVEKERMEAEDQMRKYYAWYKEGYLSSTGRCFDIGCQTRRSLERFRRTGEVFDRDVGSKSEGNGSLMRLAPVPMFFAKDVNLAKRMARESSMTTHGAQNCQDCCEVFAEILIKALEGATKEEILTPFSHIPYHHPKVASILRMDFKTALEDDIQGSGHVVRALEAALWCFHVTDNFRDAILKAANLGDDADTTAAITGQIAGAFYGKTGIPESWLKKLTLRSTIEDLAENLMRIGDSHLGKEHEGVQDNQETQSKYSHV